MTDIPKIQDGKPGMTVDDLIFNRHAASYADADRLEEASEEGILRNFLKAQTASMRSAKHAFVEFPNGTTISVIIGIPGSKSAKSPFDSRPAIFAHGDERVPTYEVLISTPGKEDKFRCWVGLNDLNELLTEAGEYHPNWKVIASEYDEDSVPELVKAVYRNGDDLNRHLILLDDHGADFFGLDLKPAKTDVQMPDCHVDLQVRPDNIQLKYWDGDIRETITLTRPEGQARASWKKVIDEAKSNPADFVISELNHYELNGNSKFQRG